MLGRAKQAIRGYIHAAVKEAVDTQNIVRHQDLGPELERNWAAIRDAEARAASQRADADQRRLRWFSAVSLLCLLMFGGAGGTFARRAVTGFDSPDMTKGRGSMTIGIAGMPLTVDNSVRIAYNYFEEGPRNTSLSVLFPSASIGKKWVIVLRGEAVLSDPSILSRGEGSMSIRNAACLGDTGAARLEPVTCQVIEGVVQPYLDRAGQVGLVADPSLCEISHSDGYTTHAESFLIAGTTNPVTSRTWAERTISLPGFEFWGTQASLQDLFQELHIEAPAFQPHIARVCNSISIPADSNVRQISNPQPQESNEHYLLWNVNPEKALPGGERDTVAFRKKNADKLQNAYIIIAGVFFAVGGGFLPVLIQNAFALRRRGRNTAQPAA
ncbi:MAG TPA: hypothetical protein VGX49_13540 [Jatrophihabitans sp.]|nr:hypothetical protein [Jatrophihabitans sp.]